MRTAYEVLLEPIISERSMDDAASRKYTFKVMRDASKNEIKAAVEEAFGVEVVRVSTANFGGKKKRQGINVGYTPAYKKAIVTVSPSSKTIEFFEGL
ncbi:MAG TPA: 50S ribosomal protein L23 [Bacillota bacterium]|nr:50S ribosomal protein L23 [Bacillota bacterium]